MRHACTGGAVCAGEAGQTNAPPPFALLPCAARERGGGIIQRALMAVASCVSAYSGVDPLDRGHTGADSQLQPRKRGAVPCARRPLCCCLRCCSAARARKQRCCCCMIFSLRSKPHHSNPQPQFPQQASHHQLLRAHSATLSRARVVCVCVQHSSAHCLAEAARV